MNCTVAPSGAGTPQIARTDWEALSTPSASVPMDVYRAYLASRFDLPPEVFVGDRCISRANDELCREIRSGAAESVTVPGADGNPMQMWILKPPGFDANKRWPVVYLVHGGPQGAWHDSWSFRWNPQMWAAPGYVIALPNPRGSTGFGQAYCEQISRDWGGKCYRDLMHGADYLEALPYVDKQPDIRGRGILRRIHDELVSGAHRPLPDARLPLWRF